MVKYYHNFTFFMNFVVILLIVVLKCILLACGGSPEATTTVREYKLELYDEGGKDYDDARAACESRDSWLVEIKDGEIDAALQTMTSSEIIWIGLSYDDLEWKWNDGSQIRYEKWASNQPRRIQSSNKNLCGQQTSSGYWRNYDCSNNFKYVCQIDTTYPGSFTLTIVDPKPKVSFHDAKTACESDGMSRLVDIKTTALNSLISEMLSEKTYYYWTGGTEERGVFSWGDGTLISKDNPAWLRSEPNNDIATENCLAIPARSKWADVVCSTKMNYICQKDVSTRVCDENNCLGKGSCQIASRRYHCTCNPGLFGTKCEKDLVKLSVDTQTIHVNRGETPGAQLTVVSYDGNVMMTRSKDSGTQIDQKYIDIATAGVPQSVSYDLGVQLEKTVYKINARPSSGHSYSDSVTVTVTVTSLCESSPCHNRGFCTDIAVSPYFSCACKPAFKGTLCEGRKFIANAKCKFHVNDDIRVTFTNANATCVDLGGSLGMLKTPEVQDLVEGQS